MLNQICQQYQKQVEIPIDLRRTWENLRFTVIDTESTGTDARRDQIISIAGVGCSGGDIELWDSFNVIVPVTHNTSSVMIHGITKEEASRGKPLNEALGMFLEWLGDGVIVGHHIGHDVELLGNALDREFGFRLGNAYIDTMELFWELEKAGGFEGRDRLDGFSLDKLIRYFGIVPHDRHTASGDAYLTAQVFIRLLKVARKVGHISLDSICALYADLNGKNAV